MKIIGFDTETVEVEGAHKPFSVQLYCEDPPLEVVTKDFETAKKYFGWKYRNYTYIGANIQFDLEALILAGVLDISKLKICFLGSSLIRAEYTISKSNTINFIDIFNVTGAQSVFQLGKMIGVPKLERPEYLGKREPTMSEWSYFKEYALNDAKICYVAMKYLYERLQDFVGCELCQIKPTGGGIALYIFEKKTKKRFFFPKYRQTVQQKLKKAYRGGRTECYVRGTPQGKIWHADVNSMYPFIMSTLDFPMISKDRRGMYMHKRTINLDNEGIAKVTVKIDADIPPLGVRRLVEDFDPFGKPVISEKLIFPNGTFTDYFTYPEIRYIEDMGLGKIERVHECFEWVEKTNPFRDYVGELYELKRSNQKDKFIYKLLLNSLYGKFGEIHAPNVYAVQENGRLVHIGGYNEPMQPTRHTCLPWASYITAGARLYIHSLMNKIGSGGMIYTDTDSIISYQYPFEDSDQLGGVSLKQVVEPDDPRLFVRAKFYVLGRQVATKGYPITEPPEKVIEKLKNGAKYVNLTIITKFRESQVRHVSPLSVLVGLKRINLNPDGKRWYTKTLKIEDIYDEMAESLPLQVNDHVV